jgi:ribonuclease HII
MVVGLPRVRARKPFFFFEKPCDDFFMKWIIGIDEVGRGALAGPVVVAAAALPAQFVIRNTALGKLKDSKKLTAKRREAWLEYFNDHPHISFALARVYPRQIEKCNVSKAANLAAERAFLRLTAVCHMRPGALTFLDGGLFLGNGNQPKRARTVVKGDEKIKAIKVASIVAKVHRDRFMCRLAKRYPAYGFEIHKGYGTKAHRRAIRKHGPSEAHRLTFLCPSAKIAV